jgi:hypothetical protein
LPELIRANPTGKLKKREFKHKGKIGHLLVWPNNLWGTWVRVAPTYGHLRIDRPRPRCDGGDPCKALGIKDCWALLGHFLQKFQGANAARQPDEIEGENWQFPMVSGDFQSIPINSNDF